MPDLAVIEGGKDILTPIVAAILRERGEEAYRALVIRKSVGSADSALSGITPEMLFARPIHHKDAAAEALAGLWLWNDHLDKCHDIVQDMASPTAAFWHAILHRREGDFSNARYWYDRCPTHHVMKQLGAVVGSVAEPHRRDPLVARTIGEGWNPNGFVDLVQAVERNPSDPRHDLAIRLQGLEWEALFDYCVHEAIEPDRQGLDDWDKRVLNPAG